MGFSKKNCNFAELFQMKSITNYYTNQKTIHYGLRNK